MAISKRLIMVVIGDPCGETLTSSYFHLPRSVVALHSASFVFCLVTHLLCFLSRLYFLSLFSKTSLH